METASARDVTGSYPSVLTKNLGVGVRGSVRAQRLIDITGAIPEGAPALRKRARVVIAYGTDLGGNWYGQVARVFPQGSVVLVTSARFPELKFATDGETILTATGLDAAAWCVLILRHAQSCVPAHLRLRREA